MFGWQGSDNVYYTAAQCPMNCGGQDKAYFFSCTLNMEWTSGTTTF